MSQSQVFQRGSATPEFNMTPLIDVTFLLIIFFMVITNFIAEESVEMIVPQLNEPKVRDFEEMNRIVVNIAPMAYTKEDRSANHMNWLGNANFVKVGSKRFELADMVGVTEALGVAVKGADKNEKGESELEVLLRADAAINYEDIEPVMAAITAAGIGKIHMVSYLPNKGPAAPSGAGAPSRGGAGGGKP